jgi:hypothetical protein
MPECFFSERKFSSRGEMKRNPAPDLFQDFATQWEAALIILWSG